jgi:hypothetical protein
MFAALALLSAIPSAWASTQWNFMWAIASFAFCITAGLTLLLAVRPTIEIYETHLNIGARRIFWAEIQRVDRVSVGGRDPWTTPLLLRLVLSGGGEVMLFHPGDVDSCVSLLRHVYRYSRAALLDGSPYAEFWGEPGIKPRQELPRPRLLLPEDEDEIERMFQRLQAGERLDGPGHAAPGSRDQRSGE